MPVRFRVSWPGSEDSPKATERSRLVKKILALAGVIGLSLAGSASGAVTLSALDKHYIESSAKGDHFEITGGKLAAARGTNPKIKALGSRLEKDHSKSLKELRGLGKALHVSIPKSPTHSQTGRSARSRVSAGRHSTAPTPLWRWPTTETTSRRPPRSSSRAPTRPFAPRPQGASHAEA